MGCECLKTYYGKVVAYAGLFVIRLKVNPLMRIIATAVHAKKARDLHLGLGWISKQAKLDG